MKYVALPAVDNDILLRGDICVTSVAELYRALADRDCTEIYITRAFADQNFTYTALCEFVENSSAVAPQIEITVEDTYYNDTMLTVKRLQECRSTEELLFLLEKYPTRIMATLKELTAYYRDTKDELTAANNKLATVQMAVVNANKAASEKDIEINALQTKCNELDSKLQVLVNRLNFSYEQTVHPDKLFTLEENHYKKVLYLKEVSRVHFTDTLVYYLCEILKTLYSMPVRFIVIEPYYNYGKANLYPNLKPHWNLTYRDVFSGNIFMAGFQPKLMEDILRNSSHVEYLVILDRCGMDCMHVDYMNVKTVYLASDVNDLPEGCASEDCITYDKDTLHISYIDQFETLSPESRIQMYSAMPVTQKLIEYLEA